MTLADELSARTAEGRKNLPIETQEMYERAFAALESSGIADRALGEGDTAPHFALPDAVGNTVRLSDLLEDGPVVISFYRGSWCPFCNLELRALQAALGDFRSTGATLVAISPNTPDTSLTMVEKHALTFPVLSDHNNEVARAFNLVYELTPENIASYVAKGRDIPGMNGTDSWELPLPATYVVDPESVIRYGYVPSNHRLRAEPSEVLETVRGLTGHQRSPG